MQIKIKDIKIFMLVFPICFLSIISSLATYLIPSGAAQLLVVIISALLMIISYRWKKIN